MKTWRHYAGASIGLIVLVVLLGTTSAGPALAQTFKPVMSYIVNDVSNPVPVKQVGPVEVTTGTVEVSSGATPLTVSVVPAAVDAYRAVVSPSLDGAFLGCSNVTVPTGKRAVIEYMSAVAEMNATDRLNGVEIRPGANSTDVVAALVPQYEGDVNGIPNYAAGSTVKLYLAGTYSVCAFHQDKNVGAAFLRIAVSGYLENLPQ